MPAPAVAAVLPLPDRAASLAALLTGLLSSHPDLVAVDPSPAPRPAAVAACSHPLPSTRAPAVLGLCSSPSCCCRWRCCSAVPSCQLDRSSPITSCRPPPGLLLLRPSTASSAPARCCCCCLLCARWASRGRSSQALRSRGTDCERRSACCCFKEAPDEGAEAAAAAPAARLREAAARCCCACRWPCTCCCQASQREYDPCIMALWLLLHGCCRCWLCAARPRPSVSWSAQALALDASPSLSWPQVSAAAAGAAACRVWV